MGPTGPTFPAVHAVGLAPGLTQGPFVPPQFAVQLKHALLLPVGTAGSPVATAPTPAGAGSLHAVPGFTAQPMPNPMQMPKQKPASTCSAPDALNVKLLIGGEAARLSIKQGDKALVNCVAFARVKLGLGVGGCI